MRNESQVVVIFTAQALCYDTHFPVFVKSINYIEHVMSLPLLVFSAKE
jgi:hypothetical protein